MTAWRAAKKGTMWVPSLDQIVWARRKSFIAFDSDALNNSNITHEIRLLTGELVKRGSQPHLLTLPSIGEQNESRTHRHQVFSGAYRGCHAGF